MEIPGKRWEQSEKMAAASLYKHCFFLIPKNVTSEWPLALMSTMISFVGSHKGAGGWQKRQYKYRIEWDAADGRKWRSFSEQCGILLEMER